MRKEKVVFVKNLRKEENPYIFELPIEFYAQKKVFVYLFIISIISTIGLLVRVFLDFEVLDIKNTIMLLPMIVMMIIGFFTFKIVFNKLPSIILEYDSIYLLNVFSGEYEQIEFDKVSKIQAIYLGEENCVLALFDKFGIRPFSEDATWQHRLRVHYINDKEVGVLQSFDIIRQVFTNYKNNTHNPIILRNIN